MIDGEQEESMVLPVRQTDRETGRGGRREEGGGSKMANQEEMLINQQ